MSGVVLHAYPSDWSLVVADTIIRKDVLLSVHDLENDAATNAFIQLSGADLSMKDHWGTVESFDGECLVFEPYGDHEDSAQAFADFIGLIMIPGEPAEWNKSCNRYRFVPRRDEYSNAVKVLAEVMDCAQWEFVHRCNAQDNVKKLLKATPN